MPDPWLKQIAGPDLPEPLASAWEKSMRLRGDATLFEVFGNHPTLFNWYATQFYGELFQRGEVSQPIKELLRLKLSTLHGCRFCNQGNRQDASAAGISEDQIEAIETFESGPFTDAEKAVLRLADRLALTHPEGVVDRSLFEQLKQHFSDGQILELGMLAGLLSGMAKFLFAFDLVEKEPHCPFHPARTTP